MSARRPLIAGNWKLHKNLADARALAAGLRDAVAGELATVDVLVAPVATALTTVVEALAGSAIAVAAQNCHFEASGAFTGELSPTLLVDAGCTHVILGHSERRALFGETDEGVRKKVAAAMEAGLVPIVCVGESLDQREAGDAQAVVLAQVKAALEGHADLGGLVIAYEPVWAIGTGRTATPADAQAMHAAIRREVEALRGPEVAQALRILYGGSVKAKNAADLLAEADVDGALVGGASLAADTFAPIVQAAARL